MIYDCIVIGAGPAGIAAAIQLKRAGLNIVLFERNKVGGLLRNANMIENYLGFSGGISGKKLVEHFKDHLDKQNVTLIQEEVLKVEKNKSAFTVQTREAVYTSNNVVIATGTVPKEANIEGEETLHNKTLFYEISDLPTMREKKTIIVIGGGDTGFDYALNLHEQGHVPIILTKGKTKCLPLLEERAVKKNIQCIEYCSPKLLQQSGKQVDVLCKGNHFRADYILIAVGRNPHFPHILATDPKGLYHVGDVQNLRNRQVHISTGDAIRAAMNIVHSILHSS